MSATGDYLNDQLNFIGNQVSSLDSISSALDAFNSLGTLLFGNSSPISLGSFHFNGLEVPDRVTYGGKQSLVCHKMPGGYRVFDVMGRDDHPISFSGHFIGNTAPQRAQVLMLMKNSGKPYVLNFSNVSINVLINEFTATKCFSGVDYSITLEVVSDTPPTNQKSLLQSIQADIQSATGVDVNQVITQTQTALATAQKFANAAVGLTGGSSATINLLGGLNQASGVIGGLQSVTNGNISGFNSALAAAGTPFAMRSAMANVLPSVNNISILNAQADFTGRSLKNMKVV